MIISIKNLSPVSMLTITVASILIALIFAPLGCLVLWKRYIYLGDGISHASLLAGALSITTNMPVILAGALVAIAFSVAVFKFMEVSGRNAVISLISGLMLSLALILSYLYPARININNLLFGDIIAVNSTDVLFLSILLVAVGLFITLLYNKIILIVLNRDIAQVKKIGVKKIEFTFLFLLSLSVFSTITMVGALLVTSMLLIPAMCARLISRTPSQMIIAAIIIAVISILSGLMVSFYLDLPVSAVIIMVSAFIYFLLFALRRSRLFS